MTETPITAGDALAIVRAGGALTLAHLKALGITPEDVDENWMDEMMKRLFHEFRKQISQLESARAESDTPADANRRAANARTLIGLERTLERLATLASKRDTKMVKADGQVRSEIMRKLDQCLASRNAQGVPERTDQ